MKKITKILAAAAVLACGLILSGCAAAETIKILWIDSEYAPQTESEDIHRR